jgi:phosphoglycolate phosphatase-like HAD superfamily hydrolase
VDGWTTSADVERTKPHPDLVLAALEKADAKPGDATLVGDTTWDCEAARRAGVGTIAVQTGDFLRDELVEAGALAVFESIEELRARLDETPLR